MGGADIVIHSTTKYMDGHANAVGGAIVDSGRFDWTKYPDKFPGLCTPDRELPRRDLYRALPVWGGAYITQGHRPAHAGLRRNPSPQNCYYLNIGLETLHLRVARHCENAMKVGEIPPGP